MSIPLSLSPAAPQCSDSAHHDDFEELVAEYGVSDVSDIAAWIATLKNQPDAAQRYKQFVINILGTRVHLSLQYSVVPRRVRGQPVKWCQRGEGLPVYDIIVQKICAKDSGRRAGLSAILHVESAANLFNMGVQLQQTISDSGKALGRRLVNESGFISGDDDELNWFSGVWEYNEQQEPESKSSTSSEASKPAIDHVIYHALPSKQCANCGKKGKGFKQCSRCKAVKYCSKKCQKDHWHAIHKSVCNSKTTVQVISGHKQHKTFEAVMKSFWRYKGAHPYAKPDAHVWHERSNGIYPDEPGIPNGDTEAWRVAPRKPFRKTLKDEFVHRYLETAEIKGGLGVVYAQQSSVKVFTSEGNPVTMSMDDAMNMPGNSCARAMRLMYLYPQHFNHETLRVGSVGWIHPETGKPFWEFG